VGHERYDYHLGVFSKLLRGWKSTGPIKPGTEARIVSRSKNWGAGGNDGGNQLDLLCDPVSYFDGSPEVQSMDARRLSGGTFLYRPFVRGDGSRHYSVFARIEARSEGGEAQPGRRYTHCAALIVDDHWEPELIPWAATMLFDHNRRDDEGFAFGEPIPENHKTRFERTIPDLYRDALAAFDGPGELADWPLGALSGDGLTLQAALPDTGGLAQPQVALARRLAALLREQDMAIHGRWLSFAFGIASNIEATGAGFAIRLDDRDRNDPPRAVQIPFSDSDPPVPVEADLIRDASAALVPSAVYSVRKLPQPPHTEASGQMPRVAKGTYFTARQLWPDQGGEGGAPSVDPWGDPGAGQGLWAGQTPPQEVAFRTLRRAEPRGPAGAAAGAAQYARRGGAAEPEFPDPVAHDMPRHLSDAQGAQAPLAAASRDRRRLTAAAEGFEAPQPAARRDAPPASIAIDWPVLPDEKHRWVLEPGMLPSLHKRLTVFIDLLGLIDTEDFREFGRFDGLTRADRIAADMPDTTSLFSEAFAQVVEIICIYAATGNPRRLLEPLSALLAHDAKPGIGLNAAATGSLGAAIVRDLMEERIGLKRIHLYISRQGRIARDMAAISGHGPANLVAPRPEDLEDLLDALAPDAPPDSLWGPSPPQVVAEVNRVVEKIQAAALSNLEPVFA
jgi:hypothetical protein